MVERRMRSSIKMVGDFWMSCWVKAGQPDLSQLIENSIDYQDSVYVKNPDVKLRNHEAAIEEQ